MASWQRAKKANIILEVDRLEAYIVDQDERYNRTINALNETIKQREDTIIHLNKTQGRMRRQIDALTLSLIIVCNDAELP